MDDAVVAPIQRPRELAAPLSPSGYHRLARELAANPSADLIPLRLAFLGTFTAEFLRPYLVVEAARRQFAITLYFGAFGQFEQELDDPASGLWAFQPDVVVIAMRPEDIDVEAAERFNATAGVRFSSLAEDILTRLEHCANAARARVSGSVLIANMAHPPFLPLGVFDANIPGSLSHAIDELNRRLAKIVASIPGAFVWDYAGAVRARGAERWTDRRLWMLARAAVSQEHQPNLAAHLVRTVVATVRPPSKCLVLDLDNTLWGGVIGDDGLAGIQIGDDYPGNAFKSFQRAVGGLLDRGILLAVASKNHPDVVEQALRSHPEMVLRWDHFACVKANWRPKSENLREIATELNIGVDALVLFDDNPVEREEVRTALPAVGIIDVPVDPVDYVSALYNCEFFDQTSLQAEDRERVAMYRRERERMALAGTAASPEDFLRSLEMIAEVGRANDDTLGRIVQLIGKTNQFNLTTRRHSQGEVAAMAGADDHIVAWLRLRDRFGDQGLVVVGILAKHKDVAEIDTFLMSCRVMNRHVENAFMAYLAEEARLMGCSKLRGVYRPTSKNAMVAQFYPDLGFAAAPSVDGARAYVLDLQAQPVEWPDVIARRDIRG